MGGGQYQAHEVIRISDSRIGLDPTFHPHYIALMSGVDQVHSTPLKVVVSWVDC